MKPTAREANFDAIVGPTHHYAGLAWGNLASQKFKNTLSNPKRAALEGLAKMKLLADLGIPQGVLPPPPRPDLYTLRSLGFSGTDTQVLQKAWKQAPRLLSACCSASAMWAANAATVSPAADAADGKVHFTPANLASQLHRAIETPFTAAMLKAIFADERFFVHHDPLPGTMQLCDEGAANHSRLTSDYGRAGLEMFVYGRSAFAVEPNGPSVYPARQTLEASAAVARSHRLDPRRVLLVRQSPRAVDAGVFHNDVIAVGNLDVLFFHTSAFAEPARVKQVLKKSGVRLIEAPEKKVPLADAVRSYLFNSQLVSLADDSMMLIAAEECRRTDSTRRYLCELLQRDTPIRSVRFVDIRQSMHNGGGPACLRLRVVLEAKQMSAVHAGVWLTDSLYEKLTAWVGRHYRDRLSLADLADPSLLNESRAALAELQTLLGLRLPYRL